LRARRPLVPSFISIYFFSIRTSMVFFP
jgi:hypothetical protein